MQSSYNEHQQPEQNFRKVGVPFTVPIYESQGDVFKTLGRRPEAVGAYGQARQALPAGASLAIARLFRKQGSAWLEERRYAARECIVQAQAVPGDDLRQNRP